MQTEINFEAILIDEWAKQNCKHLATRIFREWKNAEANHFSKEEFFDGFNHVIEKFKREINESSGNFFNGSGNGIVLQGSQFHIDLFKQKIDEAWGHFILDENPIVNELLDVPEFRVNDFLETELKNYHGQNYNFVTELNRQLLNCGYKQPKEISVYGYAVERDSNVPEQINMAFLWIKNTLNRIVKEVQTIKSPSVEPEREITLKDKTLRELGIIEVIFTSQRKKKSQISQFDTGLADKEGKPIDGKYLVRFDILSDWELFSLQKFKQRVIDRYENANKTDRLIHELTEIYNRAVQLKNYYNLNLTRDNKEIDEFYKVGVKAGKENHGVVSVIDYRVDRINFDCDFQDVDKEYLYGGLPRYNYPCDNQKLAEVCQILIQFIETLNIGIAKNLTPEVKELLRQEKNENAFENCLTDKGKEILPYLISTYKDAKPQLIASMLFALNKLRMLNDGTLKGEITDLHRSLEITFGNIGTRQSLDNNIKLMELPNFKLKGLIEKQVKGIEQMLTKK